MEANGENTVISYRPQPIHPRDARKRKESMTTRAVLWDVGDMVNKG